jgi:hypothetical protein
MEIDERTGSIQPAGVMVTACTHRRPEATREAPAVIAVTGNSREPGRAVWGSEELTCFDLLIRVEVKISRSLSGSGFPLCEPQGAANKRSEYFRSCWLFLSQKSMADVRPELLDDVIEGGGFQPCCPVLTSFTQATLLRGVI